MTPGIEKARIITALVHKHPTVLVKCRDADGFNYFGIGEKLFTCVHYCTMQQTIEILALPVTEILEVIY